MNEKRVGFIPNPKSQKDVDAVIEKTMKLFNEGIIDEICIFNRSYLCRQIMIEAGFPQDRITVLLLNKENEMMSKFVWYLKNLPRVQILVCIVAVSYHCPRYVAKLRRMLMIEENKNSATAPRLSINSCEVYPRGIDWLYPFHLLAEWFRIAKDALAS